MSFVSQIGEGALGAIRGYAYALGTSMAAIARAFQPSAWSQPVQDVFARQIYFTGIQAIPFVALIAATVGVSFVVQIQFWLGRMGQSDLLGPILVVIILREPGPLLTNLVVIGRSGGAIASELAAMKVNGEIALLEADGVDPLTYLVMPRVLGVSICVFCLTILFSLVSFITGLAFSALITSQVTSGHELYTSVFNAIQMRDFWNLALKSLVPGLTTGAICCAEGLAVKGALSEIPQATTRGIVRSVAVMFVISALVSMVTYM